MFLKLYAKFCSLESKYNIVFKKEYPKESSYTQSNLVSSLLKETYAAHNSLDDVKALKKLSKLVEQRFLKYTFGVNEVINSASLAINKKTLQPLQAEKIVFDSMATKIARAGLNYSHLKLA